jgi:hypothetical protein
VRYWWCTQSNTHRTGCNGLAEQPPAADALQPPLRCGFRARLRRSVRSLPKTRLDASPGMTYGNTYCRDLCSTIKGRLGGVWWREQR